MSNIYDKIFSDVCLDERITDGIFRMDEEQHMDALRDYLVKRGIEKESAINITNRMIEGKYPERQAYRTEDGILVTFPSPQHKQKAIQKNPGKYVDKDPRPKSPEKKEPKQAPPGSKPEPGEIPSDKHIKPEKEIPIPSSDISKSGPKISSDDKKLEIEPPQGGDKPEPLPAPPKSPTIPEPPRTPEKVAAEKEITKQIMKTDDTTLSNVSNPLFMNEKLNRQLNELYKKASELGFSEAITFLTPYIKS